MILRMLVALFLATLAAPASAIGKSALLGTWEAARTPEDERLYVTFKERGRVEIVAEYDFTLPGAPGKRRGRSTTYGKWSVQGDDVSISYAKVRERLRYVDKLPLSEVGLRGTAAGLRPIGSVDPQSRIRGAILWKTPHDYRLKPAAGAAMPALAGAPTR